MSNRIGMSVPGADLSPAADQLGLGPLLTQQTRDETDEERRKRLLEQPRRRSCHCSASAVLVRCGADDRWAYSAQESVQFSNISATNRPLAFLSDDIGSLLKGGAKVYQRQLVNEVLVPLAIEFAHNLGREGATPIGSMPAAKWGVLWPHGLDQVRIIQDLPEPPYHLAISLRLIRNHKLDGAQREREKHVAAALQRRLHGGGTDKFP